MDLKIYHDRIINTVNRIISNERDRSSDAGEDRESIGSLIEQIGVNKKAMSMVKALHKMEPDKREDTLRSFDALRIEFEKNWGGQKTADMFDETEAEEPLEPVEAEILSRPTYGDDGHLDDDEHGYRQGLKDDDLADETVAFEDHLAEVAAQ
jgi:hypothetical protein